MIRGNNTCKTCRGVFGIKEALGKGWISYMLSTSTLIHWRAHTILFRSAIPFGDWEN